MNGYDGPAEDATEQVRRWDAGDTIWTIEMGGMGPGYEQAIQVLAVEITRDNLGNPLPDKEDKEANRDWGMATVERIDAPLPGGGYACGGFSGAQVGKARWLAYAWLSVGPKSLHEDPNYKERHIQASNFWPRVPETSSSPSKSEERSSAKNLTATHVFKGRPDRWCEVCNKPDKEHRLVDGKLIGDGGETA